MPRGVTLLERTVLVQRTAVGISQATDLPWRFWETDATSVSVFRAGGSGRGGRGGRQQSRGAGQDGSL